MIRWLSLLLLATSPVALAQSDSSTEPSAQSSELPTRLDDFLSTAIDEGLLVPTDEGVAAQQSVATPTGMKPVLRQRSKLFETAKKCAAEYPYDFTDFRQMKSYQDLYPYQEAYRAAGSVVDSAAGTRMAKAYAALNLSSELRTHLRGSEGGHEAIAMGRLIALLDANDAPDLAWFRAMADCHSEGEFWLAVALLLSNDDAGVEAFDQRLTQFRRMPIQVRIRLAGLLVPILNSKGERVLVSKVMADFTAEEVELSSQLRFAKALIDLQRGSADAEATIQSMASQPRFQEIALEGLLRSNVRLDPGKREILLREAQRRINRASSEDQIAASLRFTLREYSAASRYSEMIDLLELTSLQAPFAQNEIRRQLVDTLHRDLEDDSALRALAAMDLLLRESATIDGTPGRSDLFQKAVKRANALGLLTLSEIVAQESGDDELLLNARVELSLTQQRHEDVLLLASQKPDYQPIQLAAAHAAIALKQKSALTGVLPRLPAAPSELVSLLEADAVAGTWYLPQAIYNRAKQTSDDDLRRRVDRVASLKSRVESPEQPGTPTLADATEVLSRSLPGQDTELLR